MPHLDREKPECAKAILRQESGEKEWVTSSLLFYGFGDGPQGRFGFQLYAGFFSPAALKKAEPSQNSMTSPKKFKAICSEAAL